MIIKSSLGLSFGVVFSVLLFKRRAWPAWVGLGFGAGRAWEEADGMFTLTRACRRACRTCSTLQTRVFVSLQSIYDYYRTYQNPDFCGWLVLTVLPTRYEIGTQVLLFFSQHAD